MAETSPYRTAAQRLCGALLGHRLMGRKMDNREVNERGTWWTEPCRWCGKPVRGFRRHAPQSGQ